MAEGVPPRGTYLTIGGPNWLGNLFHNILCGVLIVQVYIYYAAFPKDSWRIKTLVYTVFVIEIVQTVIRSVDRWEVDVMRYGDPAILDAMQLDWFSTPFLTAVTSGLVQAFFGYRIYIFSKSWAVAGTVWVLTLLQSVSGVTMASMQVGVPLHVVAIDPEITKALLVWVVSTVVTDVLIAGLLTYFLWTMKSGLDSTDKIVTKIIRRTVETGLVTALTAIVLMILYLKDMTWFLMLGDVIGKLYSNNLMVMFNRRINFSQGQEGAVVAQSTVGAHSQIAFSSGQSGSTGNKTLRPFVTRPTDSTTGWELDERAAEKIDTVV